MRKTAEVTSSSQPREIEEPSSGTAHWQPVRLRPRTRQPRGLRQRLHTAPFRRIRTPSRRPRQDHLCITSSSLPTAPSRCNSIQRRASRSDSHVDRKYRERLCARCGSARAVHRQRQLDMTARLGGGIGECVATFQGHEQSVWAVLAVDHDRVFDGVGGQDDSVVVNLESAKPLAVFGGHTDAVRGLTLL